MVRFWDTKGKVQDHWLGYMHFDEAKIVFLCIDPYSCTSNSFAYLSKEIHDYTHKNTLLVLIETKLDKDEDRSFFDGQVEKFKKDHAIQHHYKTSAKTGWGLDEIDQFLSTCIDNMHPHQSSDQESVIQEDIVEDTNYSFVFKALTAVAAVAGASLLVAGIALLTVTTFGIAGIVLAGVGGLLLAGSAVGIGFFKYNSCSNPAEEIEASKYSFE